MEYKPMPYPIIDSHCHLDFPKFNPDREEAIQRARKAGVVGMVNSGISLKGNRISLELTEKNEDIHAALGLSPDIGREGSDKDINAILAQIEANAGKAVAIGEAGLDFQDCKTDEERRRQTASFKKVIELAKNLEKPLVVHARMAEAEVLELARDVDTVIYHCYSGSVETMKEIVDAGYYISLATLVCFSEHHQTLAAEVPPENLLLETDSPFLSPRRGRNEPAFIVDSIPVVAKYKEMEPAEIAKFTTENARRVFKI
ncbi:TatD family hydrolase [Methanosarcina mazei]|jgi:TatD DNase family protein|uniref:Membrane protein n=3 Tax=Methanosarcina mazei TaxID=2209 RepID=A0A0F8NJE9_METMZ|nr:TatD family hydrolase [Methanosarcina mazei]AKB39025.1 Putative deoxyribonuclease YcfH [Methanosarcina mazei WWM610]AKB69920.1 Putative deoxyribonuclease YcfH [Methanosarcina mazei C16]KKG08671.1 membrane protein [Methanosarcina mazei]KKG28837.1 membrane protein [Methanosarcina mazei]KKG32741.1 membrane protein [Methanosarcina mazei]